MALATSRPRRAALRGSLGWSPAPRRSRALNQTAWPRPSYEPSGATMSGSPLSRTPRPPCACFPRGWRTITRFTRTKPWATVHPASSSLLAQPRDPVRSFGGNNSEGQWLNRYTDVVSANVRLGRAKIAFTTMNDAIFGLENIITIYLAARLALSNTLTVGMIIAFMSYKQ